MSTLLNVDAAEVEVRMLAKLGSIFRLSARLRRRGPKGPSEYERAAEGMTADDSFDADRMMRACMNRYDVISRYGFAIPCEEAIDLLARCPQPIAEVGAGLAYWAHLLRERYGVAADCYDTDVPPSREAKQSFAEDSHMRGYHFDQEPWHPVLPGTPESLRRKNYQTLLLIWPDYGSRMALDSLRCFSGSVVVSVGEGSGGCTGDDKFHDKLDLDWLEVFRVPIPRWQGLHDDMTVHVRRSTFDKL